MSQLILAFLFGKGGIDLGTQKIVCFEITLSPVDRYDPDKRIYTTNDLSTRSGIVVFYSIDENQTVSLASHPDLLPKTASSRPQASSEEQTIPAESSEESLPSSLA